jgi:hypothetical protein
MIEATHTNPLEAAYEPLVLDAHAAMQELEGHLGETIGTYQRLIASFNRLSTVLAEVRKTPKVLRYLYGTLDTSDIEREQAAILEAIQAYETAIEDQQGTIAMCQGLVRDMRARWASSMNS